MLNHKQSDAADKLAQLFAPEFSIFVDHEDWYNAGDDSFSIAWDLASKVAKILKVDINTIAFEQIIDRSYSAIEELI